jgi:hypothetical protein
MDPNVVDLARRFKAVLDEVETGRKQALAHTEARLAEGRAARSALLQQLVAFGRAVGHLQVSAREDRVALAWGSQAVSFLPEGDGDRIRVRLGGLAGPDDLSRDSDEDGHIRIYRHPDMGDAWVLSVERDDIEDVEPLFDAGIVHLLTEGLGIPEPEVAPPPPQPPLDDLVPE